MSASPTISVFSSRKFFKTYLEKAIKKRNVNFNLNHYYPRLEQQTVRLAQGSDAICAFVNDQLDAKILNTLNSYKINKIALMSAGFNNVDLKISKDLNFQIARVPKYSPNAVAEHAVCLVLALNRKIKKAIHRVTEGNFELDGLMGFNLYNKTVGIIGTGEIGTCFAQIMKGFGCNIICYDLKENKDINLIGGKYVELKDLYKNSDIISLHCPSTSENEHMINKESIAIMKDNVMLINTGRGNLIDTKAAVEGLKSGKIGYFGMDTYENEQKIFFEDKSDEVIKDDNLSLLLSFNNVIVTSHQAFFTEEAVTAICDTTIDNLIKLFNHEKCENLI